MNKVCLLVLLSTILCCSKSQLKFLSSQNVSIRVKDYGVVGNGRTDDTENLRKAFRVGISKKAAIIFETGKYLVSGSISEESEIADGELHLICEGNVEIIVDKNKSFLGTSLLPFFHTNITNSTIKGGILNIDLNNKCPVGIAIYAFGRNRKGNYGNFGGELLWTTPITVKNAYAGPHTNGTAAGIQISGIFKQILIDSPTVENISRYEKFPYQTPPNKPIDETKGISITNIKGNVIINSPTIRNISTPNNRDADGIAVFGYKKNYNINNENYSTLGSCTINNAKIYDAQGRGMKFQCSDVIVNTPYFLRQNLISITQGHDIDFQWGNGQVFNSVHEYRLKNGTSPIKSVDAFTSIVFQNKLKKTKMLSIVHNAALKTEVQIARFILALTAKNANSWDLKIDSVKIVPLEPISITPIKRSIVEFNADDKEGIASMAKNNFASIFLMNIEAPNTNYAIGYTGCNGSLDENKISLNIINVRREKGKKMVSFYPLSGQEIKTVRNLKIQND